MGKIYGIGVLLILGVIFFFSSQNNYISTKYSNAVKVEVENTLPHNKSGKCEISSTMVRKSAHIVLYGSCGVMFLMWISRFGKNRWWNIAATILFGGIVGSIDEINQHFFKNRGSSPWDVLIDIVGVCLFISVYFLIKYLLSLKNKKNNT